jgi:hypothetical protein
VPILVIQALTRQRQEDHDFYSQTGLHSQTLFQNKQVKTKKKKHEKNKPNTLPNARAHTHTHTHTHTGKKKDMLSFS